MEYGSSSNLVVGQSLLAIGNPFGLDRTITSGLVSATGRSVTGVAGNQIKNCIQTDCAINPGNSGGPLLNLKGEVVGVNTMIISASGSSSGIGFAVPGDSVKESADKIIELDKQRRLRNAKRKGRGWLGAAVATSSLEESLRKRLISSLKQNKNSDEVVGAFITSIDTKSPLMSQEGVSTTSITNGNVQIGDRIVSVGGNAIENAEAFVTEMKGRVEGENLSLTIENVSGERRVVYVTLGQIPL
ncbi:serine protease, Do/DeqQ family [Skeletonema marinoi]|nr:serine protease, Do/DeqQ family [Skeletonema marinoi]